MKMDIDFSDFDRQFDAEVNRIKKVVYSAIQRAGETYVTVSREKGSYKDQTGNLRSANGYGILDNGVSVLAVAGRQETIQGIKAFAGKADIVGVFGNGMDYASAVESRGRDVTSSGFLAAEKEFKRLMK